MRGHCLLLVVVWNYANRALGQSFCSTESENAIQNCAMPVKQFAATLGHSNAREKQAEGGASSTASNIRIGQLLPVVQAGDMFEKLCGVVDQFEYCVMQAKQQCPNNVVLNLIEVSYGFLCNEGREIFVANAECLTKLDQIEQIKNCHETTMRAIVSLNEDPTVSVNLKMSHTCRWLNHFTACVQNRVISECGLSAWYVVFRVLKDTTTTLMPNCMFQTQKTFGASNLHNFSNFGSGPPSSHGFGPLPQNRRFNSRDINRAGYMPRESDNFHRNHLKMNSKYKRRPNGSNFDTKLSISLKLLVFFSSFCVFFMNC